MVSYPQVPEETTIEEAESLDRANWMLVSISFGATASAFNAHAPLLQTGCFAEPGLRRTPCARAEDWEMWQRLLRHGYRFVGVAGIAGVYRQRRASMVRRDPQDILLFRGG